LDQVAPSEEQATSYGDDRKPLLFVVTTNVQTAQLCTYNVSISLNDQPVHLVSQTRAAT
jgi:hypothetical protein